MKARALVALGLLAAFALGYQVRSLTRESAFRDGRVYFYGTDGWYHMRRIDYALANGLRLRDFPTPDPYLNYPEGGEGYWGPLFDLGIAAGLGVFGVETRAEREHLAAIVPAVLGALCSVAVFFLGRALFGAGTGVAAAFLLAVLPGHVTYSQLGHLDHHVLESLLFCLLLFLYYRLLHAGTRPHEIGSVAATVLLFLVTPFTSIAHAAALVVFAIADTRWGEGDGRLVARSLVVSALLLLPVGLYWSTVPATGLRAWASLPRILLFERYSLLQPLLLLAGAIAIRLSSNYSRRLAIAGAALGALCAWPIASGLSVLVKGDPDLAFTSETQSVLFVPGADGLSFGPALELFGLAFPLVPFAAAYLFYRFRRDRGVWLLTLVLFGLVLVQLRFIYTFAFAMALLLARLPALLPRLRWLGAAGVVLSLFPCASWIDAVAQNQHYATISKETYDALEWMRDFTPTPDTMDYSVLAPWDVGHAIVYIAERPVVADPFNHGFEPMARYFTSSDPSEAKAILDEHRVRYVIPTNLSHPYLRAMYRAYARRPPGFTVSPEVEGRGPLALDPVYQSPHGGTVTILAVR